MEMERIGGWKFEECLNDEKGAVRIEVVKVEEVYDVNSDTGFVRRGGSIAERRAAKCGFDAPKINVARFRCVSSPLSSPCAASPYITIPPGISPTALLDSPVMLPNSQAAYPSPTTGTYMTPSFNHESRMLQSVAGASDGNVDSDVGSSLSFKLDRSPISFPCISDLTDQPPMDLKCPIKYQNQIATDDFATGSSDYAVKLSEEMILHVNGAALKRPRYTNTEGDQMFPLLEPHNEGDTELSRLLKGQHKEAYLPIETLRTSEDGYNWRKYGQKQVQGSEYPRSYYKCTNPNCQVKKKVERSLDGQITEIIYKGAHNRPKPQPSRRAMLGCQFSPNETSGVETTGPDIKAEGAAFWRNIQLGLKNLKNGPDCRPDGERTPSTSVLTEISDIISNSHGKLTGAFESSGTPDFSSAFASHDGDDEDGATQGSISLEEDANDGESESKRRRKESCIIETSLTSRTTREPRIVLQIESEIDVLDDGYRWRKYGQKVVKGNPNPRSYYKCTSAGCPVRKHVERASHNFKSVITTYEGKHNHEVPVAKNNSQANSVAASLPPTVTSTQSMVALARTTNASKLEPHIPGLAINFERNQVPCDDFVRPYIMGNFGPDMKFGGGPSICQVKLPPLANSMSFGSFLINPNLSDAHLGCSVISPNPYSLAFLLACGTFIFFLSFFSHLKQNIQWSLLLRRHLRRESKYPVMNKTLKRDK